MVVDLQRPVETPMPLTSKRLTLGLLCLATFMVVLDTSIVAVALPSMQHDLGLSEVGLQWVLTSYALVFGGLLLFGGRCADIFGRRHLFLIGLAVFALASFGGGLAVAPWMLIAARVVQGIGAAILAPAALALITSLFAEGPERDRALGVYAAMAALGFTSGMVVGGILTELLNWRWVMFVNVPIALVALLVAPIVVPESHGDVEQRGLDLPGAVTVTLGLGSLLYALGEGQRYGWIALPTLGLGGLGALLLVAFVLIEHRSPAPLVPLSFFRMRTVVVASVAMMLKSTVVAADTLVPTLYFQGVLEYSALQSGLSIVPMGLVAIATGLVAGRLLSRLGGVRPTATIGLVILAVGLLMMTQMPTSGRWPVMLAGMMIAVSGYLLAGVALTIAATNGLSEDRRGLRAGVFKTSAQLGAAWGFAIVIAVVTIRTEALGGDGAGPGALIGGFQYGLLTAVILVMLALVLVLVALRDGEGVDAT